MKLRWKYFLVLVTASLVPLLTVTWISQNASRRLGKTIAGRNRANGCGICQRAEGDHRVGRRAGLNFRGYMSVMLRQFFFNRLKDDYRLIENE